VLEDMILHLGKGCPILATTALQQPSNSPVARPRTRITFPLLLSVVSLPLSFYHNLTTHCSQSIGPCTSAASTWWPMLLQDGKEAPFSTKYPPNDYYDTKLKD
jgi:hypothetical protein